MSDGPERPQTGPQPLRRGPRPRVRYASVHGGVTPFETALDLPKTVTYVLGSFCNLCA
jgi:hypothetical protein